MSRWTFQHISQKHSLSLRHDTLWKPRYCSTKWRWKPKKQPKVTFATFDWSWENGSHIEMLEWMFFLEKVSTGRESESLSLWRNLTRVVRIPYFWIIVLIVEDSVASQPRTKHFTTIVCIYIYIYLECQSLSFQNLSSLYFFDRLSKNSWSRVLAIQFF